MRPKKEAPSLNHYDTIEHLPLYNWDKYSQTNDYNWFLIDFTGKEPKIKNDLLRDAEVKILDEYFKAINDNTFLIKLRKWAEIDKLTLKYNVVSTLLEVLSYGFAPDIKSQTKRAEIINEINSWGYNMLLLNTSFGDGEQINLVFNAIQGIKTKIAIIKDKIKSDRQVQSTNLNKQIQIVTISLQYPYRLNPKEITVAEWIELTKMVEEKAKQN